MQGETLLDLLKTLQLQGMLNFLQEKLLLDDELLLDVDLLIQALQTEWAYRQGRSFAYRLRAARLPQVKQLCDFQITATPIKPQILEQLKQGGYINTHDNIIVLGGTGSGKTHLAIALAYTAIEQQHRVRFYKFNELARILLKAQERRYELNLMAHIQRFDLVVIDELGYVPIESQAGALLFELFSNLYERTSLIITSHLNFQEWGELFGSAKATKGVIDRLTHHCKIIDTGQQSWRLRVGSKIATN
jgi:DNA replication protein DnaC